MMNTKSATRQKAGLKAKREGSDFESLFQVTCRNRLISCTRIPDGCKRVGPKRLIQVKTPFDWILSLGGRVALIDTKSIDAKNFPLSKIEEHQVREMFHHELKGTLAGYVVYLREIREVIFIPSSVMIDLFYQKGSISVDHFRVTRLGSMISFDPTLIFMRPTLEKHELSTNPTILWCQKEMKKDA